MTGEIAVLNIMEYPTRVKITIVVVIHDGENILIVRKPKEPYSALGGKLIFPSADLLVGEDYTKLPEAAKRIIKHDLGLDIEEGKIFGVEANLPRLMKDAGKKEYIEFVITACLEARLIFKLESADVGVLKRWEEAKWVPLGAFFEPEFDEARYWLPQALVGYLSLMYERMVDAEK